MDDYKTRYEEALAKARDLWKKANNNDELTEMDDLESIFPEIIIEEDERTRSQLIGYVRNWERPDSINYPKYTADEIDCARILDWLGRTKRIESDAADVNHCNRILSLLEARKKEAGLHEDEYQATIEWFLKFKDKVYLRKF